jgi:GntR family transcriptional regulator, carbon starvation induced regulator
MATATATRSPRSTTETSAKTMADQGYARLRAEIIAGLLPPGAKLRIERLKKDYEIGATPLREALSKLSADGFVIAEGQRGFRVAPMSTSNLQDLSKVRILIETETLRDSIEHGSEAWEANLVGAYYQLSKIEANRDADYDVWERANDAFHSALLAGCSSELLPRLHRTLYDQHKRYRNIALLSPSVPRDVHSEHRDIYEAALKRDAANACAATEQHIRRTMEVTFEIIRKAEAAETI